MMYGPEYIRKPLSASQNEDSLSAHFALPSPIDSAGFGMVEYSLITTVASVTATITIVAISFSAYIVYDINQFQSELQEYLVEFKDYENAAWNDMMQGSKVERFKRQISYYAPQQSSYSSSSYSQHPSITVTNTRYQQQPQQQAYHVPQQQQQPQCNCAARAAKCPQGPPVKVHQESVPGQQGRNGNPGLQGKFPFPFCTEPALISRKLGNYVSREILPAWRLWISRRSERGNDGTPGSPGEIGPAGTTGNPGINGNPGVQGTAGLGGDIGSDSHYCPCPPRGSSPGIAAYVQSLPEAPSDAYPTAPPQVTYGVQPPQAVYQTQEAPAQAYNNASPYRRRRVLMKRRFLQQA
ncbi:hypothetical protein WR25_13026 [Diploscapter pachys]|uniref:Nematode cuticle collagen N-terminal domain-containing protein n=1 Tax=Diploscapter pachys TaxID=2018661 RepID=A0A2A2JUA6_9BILA|nr:hypothetical protein WR25_13026 [Diploscapter pachys]